MNTRTSLITVTSLTATFVALTAAFFSVTGIAKLFAGATMSVLIMASALELGKIVGISFLYQYWKKIPKLLKGYLTTASVILMLITSIGIYGFLSSAYQTTADELAITDSRIAVVQLKRDRFNEELTLSMQERDRLSASSQELSRGLANNVIQYRDTTGQLITTTSGATRAALQQQLSTVNNQRTRIMERVEALSDSVTAFDIQILEINASNDLAAEIGPLRFISELTGLEMNMVVNIFALMIVFVFDPLAVALIIAVNFLIKNKDEEDEPEVEKIVSEEVDKAVDNIQTQVIPDIVSPTETIAGDVEIVEKPSAETSLADKQYFTRGDFDWSKTELWKDNPIAVAYYNYRIKPNIKTLDK